MLEEDRQDDRFAKLVRRAIVPKGYRPRTDAQAAQMLDTISGVPIDAEMRARLLSKIDRTLALGPAPSRALPPVPCNEVERELLALHRSQGQVLPADVADKIKRFEAQAAQDSTESPSRDAE